MESQRVFGFNHCYAVKLSLARLFGAGTGGMEGVGVGFGKTNSKTV